VNKTNEKSSQEEKKQEEEVRAVLGGIINTERAI
jgi:hypothetical protein